jgi:hypothetical protein
MKYWVITAESSERFSIRLKKAVDAGWAIKPETLKAGVHSTSNAWKAEAQASYVFAVVVEKEEA